MKLKNMLRLLVASCAATMCAAYAAKAIAACWESPDPNAPNQTAMPRPCCIEGTNTPPDPNNGFYCCVYVLDTGAKFGTCQPCYEPSYKKCEQDPENLLVTEYAGNCTGPFTCTAVQQIYPPYPLKDLVGTLGPVAFDAGFCPPG